MKKLISIVFIILLVITFYEITITYSLFESDMDLVVNSDIGRWQIKLNDSLINNTTSFSVTNVTINNDVNTRENYFAPGTEGYFDVIIDPNDTDVSIYYEIVCRTDMILNNQISLTRVEKLNDNDLVYVAPFTYASVIDLDEIDETITLRFYIQWNNNENNNEVDSLYGRESSVFEIPMSISFKQYLGEAVVEYNS